jgi:hypothetical protein
VSSEALFDALIQLYPPLFLKIGNFFIFWSFLNFLSDKVSLEVADKNSIRPKYVREGGGKKLDEGREEGGRRDQNF